MKFLSLYIMSSHT